MISTAPTWLGLTGLGLIVAVPFTASSTTATPPPGTHSIIRARHDTWTYWVSRAPTWLGLTRIVAVPLTASSTTAAPPLGPQLDHPSGTYTDIYHIHGDKMVGYYEDSGWCLARLHGHGRPRTLHRTSLRCWTGGAGDATKAALEPTPRVSNFCPIRSAEAAPSPV